MSAAVRISLAFAAALAIMGACDSDVSTDVGDRDAVEQEPTPSIEPTQSPPQDFDARDISVRLRPVAEGFQSPLLVTNAGDGSDRLFVVEQDGLVWILDDGEVLDRPFLDITSKTEGAGEQGLLGLAFHPDFASNGRLYVDYTDNNGDTVVAEYRARGDRADPSSERALLLIGQPFDNHNGGAVAFGLDGYLYVALGDGGSGGDPMGNGQSLNTLLGKLLRIDVDSRGGDRPYGIPPDNPFAGGEGEPEIWAYGLRNPWRFSFDDETLWIADVGQNEFEEVNRVPAGRGGVNYGWNITEGASCYETEGCDKSGLTDPLATYTHDDGCSVTGGNVYRGRAHPDLVGGYFFADYCSGKLWAVDAEGPDRQEPVELLETGRSVSSFGLDERGELYLTDLSSGEVLRLTGD